MGYYIFGDVAKFTINELMDNPMEVHSVHIVEALYGELTTIKFEFSANEDWLNDYPINKEVTGFIETDTGYKTEFEGYIYAFSNNNTVCVMDIICCKPRFTKDIFVTKYSTIDNAIESMTQMARLDDPQVKTDILDFEDPYYIYQRNQTNYALATKLCFSYKYNSIFGYLMGGLKMIDLSAPHEFANEEDETFNDMAKLSLTQPVQWSNSKYYDHDIVYADFNDEAPKYGNIDDRHLTVRFYNKGITTNVAYKELIGNYLYNTKLKELRQTANFKVEYLPDYQVGDFLKLNSSQLQFNDAFISKRIIDIVKAKATVQLQVQSININ